MKPEKISEIEAILNRLDSSKEDDSDDSIDRLLASVSDALNFSRSDKPIKVLFSDRVNLSQKEFIAACLLRILSRKPDVFWGKHQLEFRQKTFLLFDEVLDSLYKKLKIAPSDAIAEKTNKLQALESDLISKFNGLSSSISTVRNCSNIRAKYMELLFGEKSCIFLVKQFVDSSIWNKERLTFLFELSEKYAEESNLELEIEAFSKIKKEYTKFLAEVAQQHSQLSKICFDQVFRKILTTITSDFESRDEIVPTHLSAELLERKYPFHAKDCDIAIKVFVRNKGIGKAFNVELSLECDPNILHISNPTIGIGSLSPNDSGEFTFEGRTQKAVMPSAPESVIGEISWSNYGGERVKEEFMGELLPQAPNLDWQALSLRKPYALEAVARESELAGRTGLIGRLYSKLTSGQIESSIIFGQKRVGKTSIAQTIHDKIDHEENYTSIYMSVGSLDKNTPERFLTTLGEFIADAVFFNPIFSTQKLPELQFDGSITPLDRLFRIIKRLNPEHKFVITIDEFDEIPVELYQYNAIGDNFFHNVRSLSSGGNVGFMLVGGENMKIIQQSTDKLNKFESFSVDYFDRGKFWNDFQELVQRPVKGEIEFTDNAVAKLYKATEGNPFFTKLICGNIYLHACSNRSSYISVDEVEYAIDESLRSLDTNNVNHFWKDGILEDDPAKRDQIETQRRKLLIAYADIARSGKAATSTAFLDSDLLGSRVATPKLIESFASRNILIEESTGYRCKPLFFNDWLIGDGFRRITSDALDEEAIELLNQRESQAFVLDSEIMTLCNSWGLYRGATVTTIHIRSWLDQFENNTEKRLMFSLLKNIRFYSEVKIREKLQVIHSHVKRGLIREIKQVTVKYEQVDKSILLSAFGQLSNSGASYLRMYATENKISRSSSNIVEFDKIHGVIQKNKRITALVFVEDIIASGGTATEMLKTLNQSCGELLASRHVKVVVAAICGFQEGIEYVESTTKKLPFSAEVYVPDILGNQDKCFSDEAKIFMSKSEQKEAYQVAYKYGYKLIGKMPLGYQDNQLLITFHETCPNNSLPILWAEQSGWNALFSRA